MTVKAIDYHYSRVIPSIYIYADNSFIAITAGVFQDKIVIGSYMSKGYMNKVDPTNLTINCTLYFQYFELLLYFEFSSISIRPSPMEGS